jgi:hypothetical protein
MAKTMSDWIIAMQTKGLESLAKSIHTNKIEDAKRLENSGLPVFKGMRLPYREFHKQNQDLIKFLKSCEGVVIRALPINPKLPRRYKIGVRSFEECEEFLRHHVKKGQEYEVYITEWEAQERSAIIISNPKEVRLEVGRCNLDELSHEENCSLSCRIDLTRIGHLENKTEWGKKGDKKDRKTMQKALRDLELTRDTFNPLFRRGYFELVLTQSGKIKFVDYKINPMYLK